MEFESTEKTAPSSRVCVVYDPRDGRIIHRHDFVGDGTGIFGPDGREEREEQTLEGARRNHGDVSKLRVLHAPTNFRFITNAAFGSTSKRVASWSMRGGPRKIRASRRRQPRKR
jgi:hypothetical protein